MTALAGLDTCSIAFRPRSQKWVDRLYARPHRPTAGGGVRFLEKGPGGTTMGAFGGGVVFWEGRLDALLTGSETSYDLRPPEALVEAEQVAAAAFGWLARAPLEGLGHEGGEVRRFDLAYEFRFDQGRDGLAFLRTVAGMVPPRRKLDVWKGADGQPQTVYVRHSKSGVVTERLYDKGVESGSHPPGERLRYEAQRRPPKSQRKRPGVLATEDLGAEYGRSINAYMEGSHNVIAAGPHATVEHLASAVARGDLTIAKAERMVGTVALLREYGRAIYGDERKARRRLQGLREAGVALDVELPPDRVVPVGQLLRESVEAFTRG